MLFIVDHVHTAETCPSGTVRPNKEFVSKMNEQIKTSGIRVVEGYVDGPSHHFYFVVEAETPSQIFSFAVPLLAIGVTKVAPVLKWSETATLTRKLDLQK